METTTTTEPIPLDSSLLEAAQAVLNQQAGAPSPFALKDDHEFKVAEPPKPKVEMAATPVTVKTLQQALPSGLKRPDMISAPPLPGSPDSPYRKCPCLAVMPGRTCMRCLGSKWVKPCPKCQGNARIDMGRRKGADRSAPCGFCMATGQVSAGKAEIARAEQAARTTPVSAPAASQTEAPAFRRAARLPGIGSPEKKRKGKPGRRPKKAAQK